MARAAPLAWATFGAVGRSIGTLRTGGAEGSTLVERLSAGNMKRTWVGYGRTRDWTDPVQGEGREFLRNATQVKNIWVPYGE